MRVQIEAALKGEKVFVIQYDFRKYFDTISHQYLRRLIESTKVFLTSRIERHLIRAFLVHRYADRQSYLNKTFKARDVGIPQGSSMSLWLANVAGHELDRELERRNGQFARYADDVVGVAHSYEDALQIASAFEDHCQRAGLSINREKSPGIRLFSEKSDEEMQCIQFVDYLGHRFTRKGICLTEKAISRIKHRISNIIEVHLLFYPKRKNIFNPSRVGGGYFDRDLVTCLNEIRRYIYGGLNESNLSDLMTKNIRLPKVKGLMSFYILIADPEQLRELDGWLLNTIRRALGERYKVLKASFGITRTTPSPTALCSGSWYSYPQIRCETRCPSFLRGWRDARKYYARFGLGDVVPPKYYGY